MPILPTLEATLVKSDLKIEFLAQKYNRNKSQFIDLLLESIVDPHFRRTEAKLNIPFNNDRM